MPDMSQLTASDFQALGLYDPADPHAAQQLELLEYLVSVGATGEDLVDYRHDLAGLPSVLAFRSGRALTASEAAEQGGIEEQKLLRVSRAAGFPDLGVVIFPLAVDPEFLHAGLRVFVREDFLPGSLQAGPAKPNPAELAPNFDCADVAT